MLDRRGQGRTKGRTTLPRVAWEPFSLKISRGLWAWEARVSVNTWPRRFGRLVLFRIWPGEMGGQEAYGISQVKVWSLGFILSVFEECLKGFKRRNDLI